MRGISTKSEIEFAILSQDALSRDWLSDAENDYWKDLDTIRQSEKENETAAKN